MTSGFLAVLLIVPRFFQKPVIPLKHDAVSVLVIVVRTADRKVIPINLVKRGNIQNCSVVYLRILGFVIVLIVSLELKRGRAAFM
ncbi:hypothetical protein BC833DRAFT_584314 [Globomyces pollinis-pini]|nr:hypothetical protein BC833DRAFT_584314 [Globomyces pollinis-pini]